MPLQLVEQTFFNDRLVFDQNSILRVANCFWTFILSIFYLAPKDYTEENVKTIECFKKYLVEKIGQDRLNRVCLKMQVDLDKLQKTASSLTSKHVTRLLVGIKDVNIADMQEVIDICKKDKKAFLHLGSAILKKLRRVNRPDELDANTFDKLFNLMREPVEGISYEPIAGVISGRPTRFLARIIFDYYLSVKERLQLCETNHLLCQEGFYEKLAKVIVNRLMGVGTIIRVFDRGSTPRYYRVTARLITAQGNISYVFIPATKDTKDLEKIRVTRGSGLKLANIDMLSYYITDLEKVPGQRAFDSSKIFERYFSRIGIISTEIGHSIGGGIIQHRMSRYGKIKRVYLYNAPGISKNVLSTFNNREDPCSIHIIRSTQDVVDKAGSYHLGYRAKDNVKIYFHKYKVKKGRGVININPHNVVSSEHPCSVESAGACELNNLKRSNIENLRWFFGGHILVPILIIIRSFARAFFGSNAQRFSGLYIEDIHSKKYYVIHISSKKAWIRSNLLTLFTHV